LTIAHPSKQTTSRHLKSRLSSAVQPVSVPQELSSHQTEDELLDLTSDTQLPSVTLDPYNKRISLKCLLQQVRLNNLVLVSAPGAALPDLSFFDPDCAQEVADAKEYQPSEILQDLATLNLKFSNMKYKPEGPSKEALEYLIGKIFVKNFRIPDAARILVLSDGHGDDLIQLGLTYYAQKNAKGWAVLAGDYDGAQFSDKAKQYASDVLQLDVNTVRRLVLDNNDIQGSLLAAHLLPVDAATNLPPIDLPPQFDLIFGGNILCFCNVGANQDMSCGGIKREAAAGKAFLESIRKLVVPEGQAMLTNNILSQVGLAFKEGQSPSPPAVPRDIATEDFWKDVVAQAGVGELLFGSHFPVPDKLAISREGKMKLATGLYAWFLATKV